MGNCLSHRRSESPKDPGSSSPSPSSSICVEPSTAPGTDPNFSGPLVPLSWEVYATFMTRDRNRIFYEYNLEEGTSKWLHPLQNFTEFPAGSAMAVLDKWVFLIGGQTQGNVPSKHVEAFDTRDLILHSEPKTLARRNNPVAVATPDKIFVFGGCRREDSPWAELYDLSLGRWTAIQPPLFLSPVDVEMDPKAVVRMGSKIWMRSGALELDAGSLHFDVSSGSWSGGWARLEEELSSRWSEYGTAAAIAIDGRDMVVTRYKEKPDVSDSLSIGAYDPHGLVWLPLKGVERFNDINAEECHIMSVNGKLVIYQMQEEQEQNREQILTFWMMRIVGKDETSVLVDVEKSVRYTTDLDNTWTLAWPIQAGSP